MIVASPESYLCFTNHPIEETIIDDPMENIAEPPAKVAKTASTGAGGNPMPSLRERTPPEATMPMPKRPRIQPPPPATSSASSSTDVVVLKAVLQPTRKGVKKMGAKASATQGAPNIPKAASPPKPAMERATPKIPKAASSTKLMLAFLLPRTTAPMATATAPPVKSVAAPKTPPKEKAKAATGAGGDPRPLIEVDRQPIFRPQVGNSWQSPERICSVKCAGPPT